MDEALAGFLAYWFSGFVDGLERLDEGARDTVLCACGSACADSYTAAVFQEAWRQSPDLDGFLARLAERFPGASYERTGARSIRVSYARCGCDLVRRGWVRSPLLCACSAHNLRENLERALGVRAEVTLQRSILRGGPCCVLEAVLADGDGALIP